MYVCRLCLNKGQAFRGFKTEQEFANNVVYHIDCLTMAVNLYTCDDFYILPSISSHLSPFSALFPGVLVSAVYLCSKTV